MIGSILVLGLTLAEEASSSIGKKAVQHHLETPLAMGFLSYVWSIAIFGFLVVMGAEFRFDFNSLPFYLTRLLFEILFLHITIAAILNANRTTFAFLRLLTIPLLLIVDIIVGYSLTGGQIGGIGMILLSLLILFYHSPSQKKGVVLSLGSAFIAVITTSLFKYNITHYNSVVAEQLITFSIITIYFYLLSRLLAKEHPIHMLFHKVTGGQALLKGAAITLQSFALAILTPSIMMGLKRALSTFWSVIFGRVYFKETAPIRKTFALLVAGVGVILITLG